ncbi:hypothetical protein LCGC14_0469450 [marine sediment metagenome]|uniref:Uncharacterized protein n=1 Tax=marine sediment metagenome TaxID=412755 RepID=A0A0F9SCL1_9ZZZZ
MDVLNTLSTYQKTGTTITDGGVKLIIKNSKQIFWNDKFVLLELGDHKLLVKTNELNAAIQNAINSGA